MNRSFMLKITENPKFLENLNKSFYVQHRNKKPFYKYKTDNNIFKSKAKIIIKKP